jgi:hypothetical protein
MSLNHQTRTIQVFEKTCINQSSMSFTKLPFAPRQPQSDAKKIPIDYKKINPMMMG